MAKRLQLTLKPAAEIESVRHKDKLGVADREQVEIQVRTLANALRTPGEGLLRTEGALADDTEWDEVRDEIHRARKIERRGADLEGT